MLIPSQQTQFPRPLNSKFKFSSSSSSSTIHGFRLKAEEQKQIDVVDDQNCNYQNNNQKRNKRKNKKNKNKKI